MPPSVSCPQNAPLTSTTNGITSPRRDCACNTRRYSLHAVFVCAASHPCGAVGSTGRSQDSSTSRISHHNSPSPRRNGRSRTTSPCAVVTFGVDSGHPGCTGLVGPEVGFFVRQAAKPNESSMNQPHFVHPLRPLRQKHYFYYIPRTYLIDVFWNPNHGIRLRQTRQQVCRCPGCST